MAGVEDFEVRCGVGEREFFGIDDGHYVVIKGRRWRATDPAIPEERRTELTRILMAWRREVRRAKGTAGEAAARGGVQAAKVALGLLPPPRRAPSSTAGTATRC